MWTVEFHNRLWKLLVRSTSETCKEKPSRLNQTFQFVDYDTAFSRNLIVADRSNSFIARHRLGVQRLPIYLGKQVSRASVQRCPTLYCELRVTFYPKTEIKKTIISTAFKMLRRRNGFKSIFDKKKKVHKIIRWKDQNKYTVIIKFKKSCVEDFWHVVDAYLCWTLMEWLFYFSLVVPTLINVSFGVKSNSGNAISFIFYLVRSSKRYSTYYSFSSALSTTK